MSSPTQESSASPAAVDSLSNKEIDASCRFPVLVFFGSATFWFLLSAMLGLIVSIKLHSSGFLANFPALTYGRVRPAQLNLLVYGFAAQAAFGVMLWMFCRLGRVRLTSPIYLFIAAKLWNIGVLVGLIGILIGDNTGFEWLEFPSYASPILFIAYSMIGIWAAITFHARRQKHLFPSQWYLLAALFWFAWIYSTANMLLVLTPVRGVVQLCVNAWYASNLLNVWLSVIGLGTVLYFIPKLTNRPLHSYYLALFAFWTIALFGGWGFINVNAPLPSWIPALSAVAAMMMILPIICVALILRGTLAGDFKSVKANPVLGFVTLGAFSFLLAQTMNVLLAIRPVNEFLYFTYFTMAQTHWLLLGFFASVMFGAIYHIAPRVLGVEPLAQKTVRLHLIIFLAGISIYGLALAIGGIVQAINLNNPQVSFANVIKGTLPFLHTSTIGSLLVVIAALLFALNLSSLCVRCCRACCSNQSKKTEGRS